MFLKILKSYLLILTCSGFAVYAVYSANNNAEMQRNTRNFYLKIQEEDKLVCLYVYDKDNKQIALVNTRASVYSKYKCYWISEDVIYFDSSDIGSYALEINSNGTTSFNLCLKKKFASGNQLFIICRDTVNARCTSLTLLANTVNGEFCGLYKLTGNFMVYDKDLFKEIDRNIFSIKNMKKEQYFSIDTEKKEITITKQNKTN